MSSDSDSGVSYSTRIGSPLLYNHGIMSPSQSHAYKMVLQRYEIFKQQDPENGNFDVTLEFGEKKLYIHKFIVMPVSETLNSMLSTRWSKGENVIKIENYGYDDFFQFACFLYSGKCELTNENIFRMTDIAEFYGVQSLKEDCDQFLTKFFVNGENIYDLLEFGQQYFLQRFNQTLRDNFLLKFDELMSAEKFLTLKKSTILLVASLKRPSSIHEATFFAAVCKWAKHQVSIKQKDSSAFPFCLPQDVKAELIDIFPYIKFTNMRYSFVSTFIVENKFLFTRSELYDILLRSVRWYREEQSLFKLVYELAEKHVQEEIVEEGDTDFLHEAINTELAEVIPLFNFSMMTLEFLNEFLVDKKFLFSPSELYKIFLKCDRCLASEEEELFTIVYGLAEAEAAEKQKASDDKNFKLHETIKTELADVLDRFVYSRMTLNFVVENIASKRFLFSMKKIFSILMSVRKYDEEEALFDAIYGIAESEAIDKQLSSSESSDNFFNLNDAIKRELAGILHQVQFSRMNLEYVIEDIVEKKFLFNAADLYRHLSNSKRTNAQEEQFFEALYELAEKNVRKRHELNQATDFNLKAAVKEELSEIIPNVKFAEMKIEFLTDFVVKNGYTFGSADLYKFYGKCRKYYDNEEQLFKAIYILAERQANEKKKLLPNPENFNLVETIKSDLALTLPNVPFYQMSKEFLNAFVVKNEILSEEEALHVFDFRIVIESHGKSLTGAFVDNFGVKDALGPDGYILTARGLYKQRFIKLKFDVPTTPSPVQRMKGVTWYLVLEKDGIMTLKSYWNVTKSDYILTEMRSQNTDFEITKGYPTCVKTYVKNTD